MNKHTAAVLIAVLIAVLAAVPLFGFDSRTQSAMPPLHPVVMAQGGSYTAIARGYNALFSNPAGFARPEGELTLLSATMWMHSRPHAVIPGAAALFRGTLEGDRRRIEEQFTSRGFGTGGAAGIGYVGNNLGIGVSAVFDALLFGQSFPTADDQGDIEGVLASEISIIGGFAVPFTLGGARVSLGGDLRPFVRAYSYVEDATLTAGMIARYLGVDSLHADEAFMDNTPVLNGFGLGFDLGLLVEWRQATVGLSLRDIGGTDLNFSSHSLERVWAAIRTGSLPAPAQSGDQGYVEQRYYVPMSANLGVAYHPRLTGFGRRLDPVVHVEVRDLLRAADHDTPAGSLLHLHAGAQISLWDSFALRGGLYQGHPTFGAGLSVGFLDLNAALFTREFGAYPGDRPVSGASLEAALRF
ncbi:MAG: hypothetical protein EA384_00545 [Spirochaetaceae bacterium]|nr:MAG: hypothetical protein EA384_00545 [Spirochaetaceae bacterium]